MGNRRYDETIFRAALADPAVRTMADLCRAVGIVPRGANYETLRRYARDLALDDRLPPTRQPRPWRADDDRLTELVRTSTSLRQVILRLGCKPTGASYRGVKDRIAALELSTAHFTGQGWTAGRTFTERRRTVEQLIAAGAATAVVRKRLISSGRRPHRCEQCGGTVWRGRPIPLELDHIDGDRDNNELTNLRLLCPNCHAQTPTYRGRNIGRQHPAPSRDNGDAAPTLDVPPG
jgi:hypothetical protein